MIISFYNFRDVLVFVFYIQFFVFPKLSLPNLLIQILIQWKDVKNTLYFLFSNTILFGVFYCKQYIYFSFSGLNFLERCGKTGFFRSGPQPLILNEEQRNSRRIHRAEQFKKNRLLSSRANCVIPYLAHNGNYAPIQDDATGENFFLVWLTFKILDLFLFQNFCTIM